MEECTRDIDLGCSRELANQLQRAGYDTEFYEDGSRRIQYCPDIELFEDWRAGDLEVIDGISVVSLEGIIMMKQRLVQHCANDSEYSTCYLHQSCVVASQQCHRIASFLRLVLLQISGTVYHCYLGNAVLGREKDNEDIQLICKYIEMNGGRYGTFFKYRK